MTLYFAKIFNFRFGYASKLKFDFLVKPGKFLCNLQLITVCPVKNDFLVFNHSNGHNFISIYIYCYSFYISWFLYHLGCFFHFSAWGPRYRNIHEMTWRPEMTFFEDRYLEKWSLESRDFHSMTSSVLVLKKAPICIYINRAIHSIHFIG